MSDVKSISILPSPKADLMAAGLSGLCVIHCLGLPLLAAVLPAFSTWAEAEWLHRLFVILALPISIPVILMRARTTPSRGLAIAAALGLTLLLAGAFVEAFHSIEEVLTVVGALLLGSAHLIWWRRHMLSRAQQAGPTSIFF